MTKTVSKKRKKVEIRNLGESPLKDLGKDELRKVKGGTVYSCPGDCDRLTIIMKDSTVLQIRMAKSRIAKTTASS